MTPQLEARYVWSCELRISGAGLRVHRKLPGADALETLQLALQLASQTLDASGLRLSWGKPDEDWAHKPEDWHGFNRPLPFFFGPDGAERNERVRRFIRNERESYARATLERLMADYKRKGVPFPPEIRASLEREAGIENPDEGDQRGARVEIIE